MMDQVDFYPEGANLISSGIVGGDSRFLENCAEHSNRPIQLHARRADSCFSEPTVVRTTTMLPFYVCHVTFLPSAVIGDGCQ
jgi:hypothetical protein